MLLQQTYFSDTMIYFSFCLFSTISDALMHHRSITPKKRQRRRVGGRRWEVEVQTLVPCVIELGHSNYRLYVGGAL